MRTNEIPNCRIIGTHTYRSPVQTDSHGKNWLSSVDLFELKTCMPRITRPHAISLTSLLFDVGRQFGEKLAEAFSRAGSHALNSSEASHQPRARATLRPRASLIGLV